MSLAVSLNLDGRSRDGRTLRVLAGAVVTLGLVLVLRAVWQAFANMAPPDAPGALSGSATPTALTLAFFVVCALMLSWRQWHRDAAAGLGARRLDHGLLHIDEAGAVSWQSDPSSPPLMLTLIDGYLGTRLVSLRFIPVMAAWAPSSCQGSALGVANRYRGGRPAAVATHVLLSRDAVPVEHWRRLRVWVLWRQRGGRDGVVL